MNKSLKKAIDVLAEAGYTIDFASVETWRDLGFEGRGIYDYYATGHINLRIVPNDVGEKICAAAIPPWKYT
jgi:hypothetical protein